MPNRTDCFWWINAKKGNFKSTGSLKNKKEIALHKDVLQNNHLHAQKSSQPFSPAALLLFLLLAAGEECPHPISRLTLQHLRGRTQKNKARINKAGKNQDNWKNKPKKQSVYFFLLLLQTWRPLFLRTWGRIIVTQRGRETDEGKEERGKCAHLCWWGSACVRARTAWREADQRERESL